MTCSFQITEQIENFELFTPSKCFVCLCTLLPFFFFSFQLLQEVFTLKSILVGYNISCYQSSTGINLTESPTFGQYFCCLTRESLDSLSYPKLPPVVFRPCCLPCALFSIKWHLFFWVQEELFWSCWKLCLLLCLAHSSVVISSFGRHHLGHSHLRKKFPTSNDCLNAQVSCSVVLNLIPILPWNLQKELFLVFCLVFLLLLLFWFFFFFLIAVRHLELQVSFLHREVSKYMWIFTSVV